MENKESLHERRGENDNFPSRIEHRDQSKASKFRILILMIVAGLVGYSLGVTKIAVEWRNYQPSIEVINRQPPPSVSKIDFAPLWTVFDKINESYYDKNALDSQEFLNGAIEGLVNSLEDPYTVYLPPAKNTDFKQGLAGKFEGIGAELGMNGKQIIVVAPLDGSPAKKAGLRPGDAILKVNDDITSGWSLNKAVENIRGEKGTEVSLTILTKTDPKPKEVKIVRDTIQVKSVTYWVKSIKDIDEIKTDSSALKTNQNNKIIYIRLSQFGDTANKEWQNITAKADRQIKSDPSIKGIVFDLRNNPGGYLTDAVNIASEFIQDGVIVSQEDRNGDRTSFKATNQGLLYDVPVTILINKGSASASEIVAGAMRDHERAELVGETSFGKGTIQQAEDLGGGAGIHITIAKWLTPDGTWVHKNGLEPDLKVEPDTKDQSHDIQLEKAIEKVLDQAI